VPVIIPPGYANIQFRMSATNGSASGHKGLTAIGVAIEAADPVQLMEDAKDAYESFLSPYTGNLWEGDSIVLQVGTSGDPVTYEAGAWEGGSAGGEQLPPNCALLIKKLSGEGGRAHRGRMFIPSPAEDGVGNDGNLSPTQFASFTGDVNDFLAAIQAADGVTDAVIFHTTDDESPTVITSLVAQRMIATQRRRLR
jgi:hypothetical protein